MQAIFDRPTTGSDFVLLPNPTFKLFEMVGPAPQVEEVKLPKLLGTLSGNKTYIGQRYTQRLEKTFRFAMALRTDVSKVQLGYRMTVGDTNIPLIQFSTAYAGATRFPTQPISVEIREDSWRVYDVHQSGLFSSWDEDEFEGETAMSPVETLSAYYGWPYTPPERLFVNERAGQVALKVDISFEADLISPDYPFAGYATVTIRNLDPAQCRDGVIVPIQIYERRVVDIVSEQRVTEEFLADEMTIHIVPSFLVLGSDYFADRRTAQQALEDGYRAVNSRWKQPPPIELIPVDPQWQVRRIAMEEVVKIQVIEQFQREHPEVAEQILSRYRAPSLQ